MALRSLIFRLRRSARCSSRCAWCTPCSCSCWARRGRRRATSLLVLHKTLVVANAGDCRAVLGKRGGAVELSRDHKPNCKSENIRIGNLGGTIFYGYLNGQLAVARALGDWHMKGPKGSVSPLSAEPELQEIILTDEDELLNNRL